MPTCWRKNDTITHASPYAHNPVPSHHTGHARGGIDSPLQRPLLAERLKQTLANIILNAVQATMECVVQRQITLRDNVGARQRNSFRGCFVLFIAHSLRKSRYGTGSSNRAAPLAPRKGVEWLISLVKNAEREQPKPRLTKFPGCVHDVIR
jgi:hypothetical protein